MRTATRTSLLTLPLLLAAIACSDDTSVTTDDPAMTETGDGDGDPATMSGDGDGDSGDGDGDSGDGDGDSGDGDGDSGDGDGDSGDGDGDLPPLVDCEMPLQPVPEGTCAATGQAGGSLLILGDVLGPETAYINGGGVRVDNGVITCVGCGCADEPADATLTCSDAVITPGLINTHDHISFSQNWPGGEGVDRYEHRHDWREGLNGHAPIPYSGGASAEDVVAAELRFVMGGATATASAGGRFGLLRNVDSQDNEGLPLPPADSDTFPLGDAGGQQLDGTCNFPGDPGDISGENAYIPHIGEGIDRYANTELVCTGIDPDLMQSNVAVVHATGATLDEAKLMGQRNTQVSLSARSNVMLYGAVAPITLLDNLGVNIAVGTDWILSGSMDVLRELACIEHLDDDFYGDQFDDKQLWDMATTNAAFAIGAEQGLGMLKPGYIADLAVFAKDGEQLHGAVVRGHSSKVALVMRGGTALYGDAELLASDALGWGACEPLDVCGVPKRACVEEDTTSTLQEVLDGADYPLFFCDQDPVDEPTCEPSRPNEYDGPTDTDADGDGIEDEFDNCPEVFNPVFESGVVPLWEMQPDRDDDGIGDVCDPCPEGDDACDYPAANDFDGDGASNGVDNCPYDANPDQADADDDGHGDLCDACPEAANPGFAGCALSIEAIRDPNNPDHPEENTPVTVLGAYVTAVRDGGSGFWIESGTQQPFTGIAIYSGGDQPALQVGDIVNVSGTYVEYFGLGEITGPSVTVVETGDPLPFEPLLVEPAAIATGGVDAEPLESMLLRVDGVSITVQNPDAPDDYDAFVVDDGLWIDDTNFTALENNCAPGSDFEFIIGTLGWAFNQSRLNPRDINDIVPGPGGCEPL